MQAAPEPPVLRVGRSVLLIGLLAFALRAVWVLLFAKIPGGGIISDPVLYHAYGLRIAEGQGYVSYWGFPTSYYPPGYPFFLGGIYKVLYLLGAEYWIAGVVGMIQSGLWALTAMAAALTGRWAFRSQRAGLAAGIVIAVWPNLITYAGAWLSESLFVCLLAVGVAALSFAARMPRGDRRFTWSLAAAAGSIALATMVRPQVLLGVPFVMIAWWFAGMGWRRCIALAGAVAIGVAALAVPWAIRNNEVLGSPVPFSTNGGDNLCIGFHPGALGGFAVNEYCETGEGRIDGPAGELERNREARQLALDHIRSDPLSLPWLSARKVYWTYRTDDDGLRGNESYGTAGLMGSPWRTVWVVVTAVGYTVAMLTFLVGAVMAWRRTFARPRDPVICALYGLTFAGAILVPVMFFGDPRFKVAATPLFAVFAGLALAELWERWGTRGEQPLHSEAPYLEPTP